MSATRKRLLVGGANRCDGSLSGSGTFQELDWDILDKLFPPAARGLLGSPLLDVKLAEAAGQVHDGHGDDLWLPLQGQHGAQAARDTQHGITALSPPSSLTMFLVTKCKKMDFSVSGKINSSLFGPSAAF